jgi:REP element-mobilizing transposase RayT
MEGACMDGDPRAQSQTGDGDRAIPLAYLITFRCYGTWLHGDDRGSVDRDHNVHGAPFLPGKPDWSRSEAKRMKHPAISLSVRMRVLVEASIREVCAVRAWSLHALKALSGHVHSVVSATQTPERVMNDFKTWCTRRLRVSGEIARGGRTWSRHGSTRYLWTPADVEQACRYVNEQREESVVPHDGRQYRERKRAACERHGQSGRESPVQSVPRA